MASQSRYRRRDLFFSATLYSNALKIFFTTTHRRNDRWLDAWHFVRCISFACLGIQNRSEQIIKMVCSCIYSSVGSHRNLFL